MIKKSYTVFVTTLLLALLIGMNINPTDAFADRSEKHKLKVKQILEQANICEDEDTECENNGINTFDVGSLIKKIKKSLTQKLQQVNICTDDSECNNEGLNSITIDGKNWNSKNKISKINQELAQVNTCDDDASCSNEGYNIIDIDSDNKKDKNKKKDKKGNNVEIEQKLSQTNACSDDATCINAGSNIVINN